MARGLAAQIAQLLRSDEVQRIDFQLGDLPVRARDFARLADAIDAGRVHVQQLPSRFFGKKTAASYLPGSDTIRVRTTLDMEDPTDRSYLVHECVHAINDMNRAKQTRELADEAAAHLAQSLYLYQELGQISFNHWLAQEQPQYQECLRVIQRHFLVPQTDPLVDQPITPALVRLAEPQYKGIMRGVKQDPLYARRISWTDTLDEADGLAPAPVPSGGGCSMGPLSAVSHDDFEADLDLIAADLQRDFGGPGRGPDAAGALQRSVRRVQQAAQHDQQSLLRELPPAPMAGAESFDELLASARDLAERAGREGAEPGDATRRFQPPPVRGTDEMLDEAAGLAAEAAAAGGPLRTDLDFATTVGRRAAERVAGPATWDAVRDEAIGLAPDLVDDVLAELLEDRQFEAGRARRDPGLEEAALTAARDSAQRFAWDRHRGAAVAAAQQSAAEEAIRTIEAAGEAQPWRSAAPPSGTGHTAWDDRGADAGLASALRTPNLDLEPVRQPEWEPDRHTPWEPAQPAHWEPAGHPHWEPSGFGPGPDLAPDPVRAAAQQIAAERGFGAATYSVVPFLQESMDQGLLAMRSAAQEAALQFRDRMSPGAPGQNPFSAPGANPFG